MALIISFSFSFSEEGREGWEDGSGVAPLCLLTVKNQKEGNDGERRRLTNADVMFIIHYTELVHLIIVQTGIHLLSHTVLRFA